MGAIRGFTFGLADVLLPYGIIVNAVAQGTLATAMLNKKKAKVFTMKVHQMVVNCSK